MDAENPNPSPISEPTVTVIYELNEGLVDSVRVDFVKVDRDFYAVYFQGLTEFLLSGYQIDAMFDGLEELLK